MTGSVRRSVVRIDEPALVGWHLFPESGGGGGSEALHLFNRPGIVQFRPATARLSTVMAGCSPVTLPSSCLCRNYPRRAQGAFSRYHKLLYCLLYKTTIAVESTML